MTDMDIRKILDTLENHEKRIHELESKLSVGVSSSEVHSEAVKGVNYSGAKGGVLLLIKEGFLKSKKTADEVWFSLEKRGYVYKKDVVRTALIRLSKSSGQLVKIEEGGKKLYVERK